MWDGAPAALRHVQLGVAWVCRGTHHCRLGYFNIMLFYTKMQKNTPHTHHHHPCLCCPRPAEPRVNNPRVWEQARVCAARKHGHHTGQRQHPPVPATLLCHHCPPHPSQELMHTSAAHTHRQWCQQCSHKLMRGAEIRCCSHLHMAGWHAVTTKQVNNQLASSRVVSTLGDIWLTG